MEDSNYPIGPIDDGVANKMNEAKILTELRSQRDVFHKGVVVFIDRLQAELAQHRWIPVSERLPKENHEVLIYYTYERNQYSYTGIAFLYRKLWYSDDGKTVFKANEVTHWKPVILPPEKGE